MIGTRRLILAYLGNMEDELDGISYYIGLEPSIGDDGIGELLVKIGNDIALAKVKVQKGEEYNDN